ncbi:hypothetical protein RQ404_06620, partial [Streptococcus pneumoniae]|nr:hypothetical protein [Streptococcus pneumoniae]
KKHPLGEKRNHPGSKLRQGFWMVFRFGVNNWGLMCSLVFKLVKREPLSLTRSLISKLVKKDPLGS